MANLRKLPLPPADEQLSTLSERTDEELGVHRVSWQPALVLVWLAEAPGRAGEVCLLPARDPWGPRCVLGRGAAPAHERHGRVGFVRQRAGSLEPTEPLSSRHISRAQLVLRASTSGRISVENVGRCHAYRNGERFDSTELEVGDLLRLGKQALLICALRPPVCFPARRDTLGPFGAPDSDGIIGESARIGELRDRIEFAAAENTHVLLHGDTGTGKELVARAIHARSARSKRPIVARNAATLPEGLIDAELFGSARNYPNAGMPERPGLIGQAHGSSLFLDEFGELSRALQVHLLRVLDEGEYQRLGEATARHASFRLIAATNRPLELLREDVLARFRTRIALPPVSERREDIPLLARHVSEGRNAHGAAANTNAPATVLPIGFIEKLLAHDFKGNVRELQALVLRHSGEPDYDAWSDVWQVAAKPPGAAANAIDPVSPSRELVERSLEQHDWVQEKVWRALGLSSRHALSRLMRKYAIEQPWGVRPRT